MTRDHAALTLHRDSFGEFGLTGENFPRRVSHRAAHDVEPANDWPTRAEEALIMSARIRSTKKYKALIETGLSDAQALGVLGVTPAVSPTASLVAAGFTEAEATRILSGQFATPGAVLEAVAPQAAPALTQKDLADALVAQRGLAHTKGRVYVNGPILEAAARVLKGGNPEVVASSGKGRTAGVVVFLQEGGDAAIQNLISPVG